MPAEIISCPRCNRSLSLRDTRVSQVTCPHCGHRWMHRRRGALPTAKLYREKNVSSDAEGSSGSHAPVGEIRQATPVNTMRPPSKVQGQTSTAAGSLPPPLDAERKKSRARLRVSRIISEMMETGSAPAPSVAGENNPATPSPPMGC